MLYRIKKFEIIKHMVILDILRKKTPSVLYSETESCRIAVYRYFIAGDIKIGDIVKDTKTGYKKVWYSRLLSNFFKGD